MENLVRQAALAEVSHPSLGVSQQVLAVHKLALEEGTPLIRLQEQDPETGDYRVYFEIDHEPYFFVLVIALECYKPVVSAAYLEAAVRVYLSITSATLSPETITQKIGLQPTRSKTLGEPRHPKAPTVTLQKHHWSFEPGAEVPGSLERKLTVLLSQLEAAQPKIAALPDTCEICICICYRGYRGWMGGWHLDPAIICKIAALGAALDVDLYASGAQDLPA